MRIYFSAECLKYHQPGHPESPERVRSIHAYLGEKGFTFIQPQPCSEGDVLRVHSDEHLMAVKTETVFDADTPPFPNIFKYAVLSAGAAIEAAQTALEGETALSLMRPPGHHATQNRVMGFCYFNNIAIAAAKFLHENPNEKVAILDIDCHHGYGSEDFFVGNESVLFVSLHQSPLYPGTGLTSDENAINFPLLPGTSEIQYLDALEKACKKIENFKPTLLGVSAGFDTFQEDPLTQLNLEVMTYGKIGIKIKQLNTPTYIILEGGYSPRLPECVYEFIRGIDQLIP